MQIKITWLEHNNRFISFRAMILRYIGGPSSTKCIREHAYQAHPYIHSHKHALYTVNILPTYALAANADRESAGTILT